MIVLSGYGRERDKVSALKQAQTILWRSRFRQKNWSRGWAHCCGALIWTPQTGNKIDRPAA